MAEDLALSLLIHILWWENEEKCDGIRSDLFQVNTELYMDNCLDVLTEWFHGLGMTPVRKLPMVNY